MYTLDLQVLVNSIKFNFIYLELVCYHWLNTLKIEPNNPNLCTETCIGN